MPAVNNVLVVGAGLAGTATAIGLAAAAIAVDLIEVKPEVGTAGSGSKETRPASWPPSPRWSASRPEKTG